MQDTPTATCDAQAPLGAKDAAVAVPTAVALGLTGEAAMLITGDLNTATPMHPLVAATGGLGASRRIGHVHVMDGPDDPGPFSSPTPRTVCGRAWPRRPISFRTPIDLAQAIGIRRPRVAILTAVKTVSGPMPSTVDAAALFKMAERGQIVGVILARVTTPTAGARA